MASKKIIVPQGLINPNETTIIEIPAGVDSEATLIARSNPNGFKGNPSFGGLTADKPAPRYNYPSGADKSLPRFTYSPNPPSEKPPPRFSYNPNPGGTDKPVPRFIYRPNPGGVPTSVPQFIYGPNPGGQPEQAVPRFNQGRENEDMAPSTGAYPGFSKRMGASKVHELYVNPSPTKVANRMYTAKKSTSTTFVSEGTNYCGQETVTTTRYTSSVPMRRQAPRIKSANATYRPALENTVRNMEPTAKRMNYPSSQGLETTPVRYAQPSETEPDKSSSSKHVDNTNFAQEVQRHLLEIEQKERQKINSDLFVFQQARRKLVEDTTNISTTRPTAVQFSRSTPTMSRCCKKGNRPVQKVVIPKGMINPGETTIIEIPSNLQKQPIVVAKRKTSCESISVDRQPRERRYESQPQPQGYTTYRDTTYRDSTTPRQSVSPRELEDTERRERDQFLRDLEDFQKARRRLLSNASYLAGENPKKM